MSLDMVFDGPIPALTLGQYTVRPFRNDFVRRNCLKTYKEGYMKVLLGVDDGGRFSKLEILEDTMNSEDITLCMRECLRALEGTQAHIGSAGHAYVYTVTLRNMLRGPIVEQ